jgi:hypothetical protein
VRSPALDVALRLRAAPKPLVSPAIRLQRTEFLDFSLLYVFSYDVEVDMGTEKFNSPSKGPRLTVKARTDLGSVYHVWRDSTISGLGFRAIAGRMLWGRDDVALRADDIVSSEIRVSILTGDQATIHLDYNIVGYVGPGGVRRYTEAKGKDRLGEEQNPFEFTITCSVRFSTASHKYRWLNDHQGIGFGKVQAVKSSFRRVTWDIYVFS